MMGNEELKSVYDMFTATWRFFRKYVNVQTTDEYWRDLTDDGDQLVKRFGNGRFIRDVVLAVIMELERRSKGGGKNEETQ